MNDICTNIANWEMLLKRKNMENVIIVHMGKVAFQFYDATLFVCAFLMTSANNRERKEREKDNGEGRQSLGKLNETKLN